MLRTHWGNRAVSVVGNKVVRTGELAANSSESTNDDSSDDLGEADHEHLANRSTEFMDDNDKRKEANDDLQSQKSEDDGLVVAASSTPIGTKDKQEVDDVADF